ncbi:MAG: protein phosphatase CheZ [Syntrophobacteraceae bacterium]
MKKSQLKELVEKLAAAEERMAALEKGEISTAQAVESVGSILSDFHGTAADGGVKALAQVGLKLEQFVKTPSIGAEQLTTISFALGVLRGGLQEGSSEGIRAAMVETLELIGLEPMVMSMPYSKPSAPSKKPAEGSWKVDAIEAPSAPKKPLVEEAPVKPAPVTPPGASRGAGLTGRLGGKILQGEEGPDGSIRVELPAESVEKVEFLLSPFDAEDTITQQLVSQDDRVENILKSVKDFMASFAEGNMGKAQGILKELAEMQEEGGELFSEIGGLARLLHSSFQNISQTLDPELREILEDRIPDSGNRLEHILQLTEEAANTTLDHVETIRKRMDQDSQRMSRIGQHLVKLKPVGDVAQHRMDENLALLYEMQESLEQTGKDLEVILTSQGYQDLTGQIIQKVVNFQNDLESKLVGLVSTFGMKVNPSKKYTEDLYGPAHDKLEGALHSQDDIDSLLASFGF